MTSPWNRSDLDRLPRHGWVADPTPVTALSEVAAAHGLGWLGAKRDDRIPELFGGTKIRKLDFLLAAAPWADAPSWASLGAIGSGHLVALVAAGQLLDRPVRATVFWEPPSRGVTANLAYTAGSAASLSYAHGRVGAALRWPALIRGGRLDGAVVVPVGATNPTGMLGTLRAGLELAEQVRAGVLPPPDDIYVPYGSGGIAAGVAAGMALGGLRPRVHAIAVVERFYSNRWWMRRLVRDLLAQAGTLGAPAIDPPEVRVDHRFVGPGYGVPTPAAHEAARWLADLPLELVYTGKTAAALRHDLPDLRGRNVLLWVTVRGQQPPEPPGWRERLPEALARRLETGRGPSRRGVLAGAVAAAGLVATGVRLTGYTLPDWHGEVLSRWEAEVVAAAAEALLPPGPGPTPAEVAFNVDRYLVGAPAAMRSEVHQMMGLLEHGTVLAGAARRLTRLSPERRLRFLDFLRALPAPVGAAYRGIRDLCLLGFYQDPRTWEAIGYSGPLVAVEADAGRPARRPGPYDALRAPDGVLPPEGVP